MSDRGTDGTESSDLLWYESLSDDQVVGFSVEWVRPLWMRRKSGLGGRARHSRKRIPCTARLPRCRGQVRGLGCRPQHAPAGRAQATGNAARLIRRGD